ncbi:Short-chain dehydrogenase TIC 32, chloroplastic, partial [Mucuna pruriens]
MEWTTQGASKEIQMMDKMQWTAQKNICIQTQGYQKLHAYAQSKLANILHANELARRLREDGIDITANSLHPGLIITNICRYSTVFIGISGVVSTLVGFALKNVQQGASTTCYVALHPRVKGFSGEYFVDNNIARASSQGRDIDLAKKLWDFSMNLIK